MTAHVIDGKTIASNLRHQLALDVDAFIRDTGFQPGLATILVGADPASEVYVANKRKAAASVGIVDVHRRLPHDGTEAVVASTIDELAADPAVSGILLQLPLPSGLDASALIDRIPVSKDVDGLTTLSAGLLARGEPGLRPCTPQGVIALLDAAQVSLEGAEAVVVGRSQLVGTPLARLLTERNATVTIAHSRTGDLDSVTRRADVVVAAAGVAGLLTAHGVKPGAVVIDVGIHRTPTGLVGDVVFDDVATVASAITPVPGGVGPMTIAMLLRNTLSAAARVTARPLNAAP
jgi:methylenetetrahydrofolate dehydrogenase (NADP+)/methenyltetrahydrofolate cyclohydrolase